MTVLNNPITDSEKLENKQAVEQFGEDLYSFINELRRSANHGSLLAFRTLCQCSNTPIPPWAKTTKPPE